VRGPEEITEVRAAGEAFIIRTDPAGTPQGFAMASNTLTLLTLFWRRAIHGERGWRIRVRRYADDPTGPVLHEVATESREEAKERLNELSAAMRQGEIPWRPHA
jgi:hypothetical protein